jgi:hypothetical protein
MEKALRLISKLKSRLVPEDELLAAAWKAAAGPKIEAHARFLNWIGNRLVIAVDDVVWQHQLTSLEKPLLDKLERLLGTRKVARIEYRVAIPRMLPRGDDGAFALKAPTVIEDAEAAKIRDPYLRRIYLQSKRRAKVS